MNDTAIFVVVISIIVISVFIFNNINRTDIYNPTYEKKDDSITFVPECKENLTQICTVDGCEGYKTCRGGKWTPCIYEKKCTPGMRIGCHYDSCSYGMKTCDRCGDWGPCEIN